MDDDRQILVLGSSGFVGGHLLRTLRQRAAAVSTVNRVLDPALPISQYVVDDLGRIPQRFDVVFLLSAHVPYGRMSVHSRALAEANIDLVIRVMKAFPDARLVFASSVSVYGEPQRLPVDEKHPFNRPHAYGLSKLAGETVARTHPKHVILRFSSLYGPGMTRQTFLPTAIDRARAEGRIVLHGDGGRLQDYLFIEDAVEMLIEAGRSSTTGVFNAASGEARSNRDVADAIADELGGVEIRFEGPETGFSCAYSVEKWVGAFRTRPQTDLRDGIRRMLHHVEIVS